MNIKKGGGRMARSKGTAQKHHNNGATIGFEAQPWAAAGRFLRRRPHGD
ncbi:MAG: hypothetical protein ACYDHM_08375 [Acidiferrobacterales bacterium]